MAQGLREFKFCKVTNVVDGDTLDAEIDLGFAVDFRCRFRLARINTPEKGQDGYKEATEFLAEHTIGRDVVLMTTKLDKYGRYLAEVYVDGVNVNDLLLSNGMAKPYGVVSDSAA